MKDLPQQPDPESLSQLSKEELSVQEVMIVAIIGATRTWT